ncbi:MAG TPA: hypothetical protein VFP61_14260, partial [Acidimicrobiales bacterium]|nr:hypothetical protein [Acidimicrobiales bacterium]
MDDNANALAEHGRALAEAATAALPGWVARVACARAAAAGVALDPAAVDAAGRQAAGEVGHRLRELVALDVDAQRATPLALVRTAVRWPTALLRDAGV